MGLVNVGLVAATGILIAVVPVVGLDVGIVAVVAIGLTIGVTALIGLVNTIGFDTGTIGLVTTTDDGVKIEPSVLHCTTHSVV